MLILLANSSWRPNTTDKKYAFALMEPGKHNLSFGLSAAEKQLTIQRPSHWLCSEAAVTQVCLRRLGFGLSQRQVLSREC